MLQRNNVKNLITEDSSIKLLSVILLQKNLKAIPKYTWSICLLLWFLIIPCVIYLFNKMNIPIKTIKEFLSDILTVLSILIGFSITAISMIGLNLSKKTLEETNKYNGSFYENVSIYKETILIFFEYLYSLIFSLMFIIFTLFLIPYVIVLYHFKFIISCFFFYCFFTLMYWNFLSIKSLIFNLYLIIMINTMAERN